jgi:PAS domain S-box-containing protein
MDRPKRRLLVIEDDRDFIETLELVLPPHGYELRHANDAASVAAALEDFPAAVALVDVRLRSGSGLDLASELKRRRPDLLMVVMTAYPAVDSAVAALRTGVYDYLRKPFTPGELLATLARCYERVEMAGAHAAAERARRRSDARLRALVESSLDVIAIIHHTGVIKFVSASGRHQFGYPAGGPRRAPLAALVHPEDLGPARATLADCAAREGESRTLELRLRHRDGTWRWFEAAARAFYSDSAIRGVLVSARDITQRRAMEEQLRQSQRMEAIGQLTGGIAHDFNNLLTVMVGNLELLKRDLEPGSRSWLLVDGVHQAAERGAALVSHLLAFSRKQTLMPRTLNPNALVRDTIELLRRSLGSHIALDTDLAERLWPCDIDAAQLQSALLNLAVNGRDAMPDGGRLRITTRNTFLRGTDEAPDGAPHVCVSVADTGTGIAPEVRSRIFEPFFTTKEPGYGTGLGLSMVFGFVKQSRGHIRVDSEMGVGTTFALYFPRSEQPAAGEPAQAEASGSGGETILVVDDDLDVRRLMGSLLEQLGYRVRTAGSGQEALRLLSGGLIPDLLLTDLVMPQGLTGYTLADQARAIVPGLRVLFASGYVPEPPGGCSPEVARIPVVAKPFRPRELAHQVKLALGGP